MKLSIVRPSHISGSSCKQGARCQIPNHVMKAHAHMANPVILCTEIVFNRASRPSRVSSSSNRGPAGLMAQHVLKLLQH